VPLQLAQLREAGMQVQSLFLDSTTETLVHRFSETRRRHPLSRDDSLQDTRRDLVDAIEHERELLAELRERALVIDTSLIRSAQLQGYVKALAAAPRGQLTLQGQIETMRQEIARLRGSLEEQTNELANTQRQQRDQSSDFDSRLRKFEPIAVEIEHCAHLFKAHDVQIDRS
ncbi:MAG: hypothetical protein EBZ00_01695, partial [Actinobacteria bacterium]|nr:hypothetical protein [Actinomycetota bacterium]